MYDEIEKAKNPLRVGLLPELLTRLVTENLVAFRKNSKNKWVLTMHACLWHIDLPAPVWPNSLKNLMEISQDCCIFGIEVAFIKRTIN